MPEIVGRKAYDFYHSIKIGGIQMCGIIAYKGEKDAAPIVFHGLRQLEYRGYDSWGIAVKSGNGLIVQKSTQKVSQANLELDFKSNIAIGHTRWATHGEVCERNAHPHLDCSSRFAIVHNGIVENHDKLKSNLKDKEHNIVSDTDSEIIAHMIEEELSIGKDLEKAFRDVCKELHGRNAVVLLDTKTEKLLGFKNGSPLAVGIGDDEFFIASDVPAFLDHTPNAVIMEDNEMVVIDKKAKFFDVKGPRKMGKKINKKAAKIEWKAEQAEKGDYPHFLIKEIMEEPQAIARAVNQSDEDISRAVSMLKNAKGIFLIGCGTAGKVAHLGTYLFSEITGIHTNFVIGSEFENLHHFLTKDTLMIAISQSGETADILEAVDVAKEKGVKLLSLVNVQGSTLTRESDFTLMVNAGPEKAIASTKATVGQIAILMLLAYAYIGKKQECINILRRTAVSIERFLNSNMDGIKKIASELKDCEHLYLIGRGPYYPVALEGAIKILEVSYIQALGLAGGELKHYALALVEKGVPCIVLAGRDERTGAIIGNANEIRSRGGHIIGIGPEKSSVFDTWLKVDDCGVASVITHLIPLQLIAYHLALERGCDPDYCRNLAKSVTVK